MFTENASLNLIHEWIKSKKEGSNKSTRTFSLEEPIAITGLSGFFPSCMDVKSFWEKLDKDESLITEIPTERFDWQVYYDPTGKTQGTMRTKWGGFIPDIASFDPRHFNLLLFEASEMDPRVRLLLMSTWRTLEDAGINPDILKKSNTGVFIGCESNEYFQLMHNKGIAPKGLLSRADGMIANQISYNFDFLGPSEFINTMCSSFAVALHRAVMCLRSGQVDRAIVGGANLSLIPDPFIALSQEKLLSQEPTVKSFGKDAEGYLRSEGVGTILIERLSQAEREHHQIYALIKHSGVNYNGRGGMSIAAPNTDAHTKLIKACYREAQIDPRQISYIEAQGMGLPVADIVEWTAMNRALSELCEEYGYAFTPGYCRVSTLKPMAGHMHAAASLGSLLKIIRSFQTDKIHKILDYTEPNEYCEMGNTPCRIAAETTEWARKEYPRLAAFHSYGAGGSNAHILLEEYLADKDSKREAYYRDIVAPVMICFSGRTEEQLKKVITEMRDHLHRVPAHDFINLSYTLITGRKAFDYRCAVIAESIAELIEILNKVLHGGQSGNYYSGKASAASVVDVTLQPGIDLKALTKSWVNGALLQHTEILYRHHQVKCLPGLPGYPFDKQYYWLQNHIIEQKHNENPRTSQLILSDRENKFKQFMLRLVATQLEKSINEIDIERNYFEIGLTSMNIVRMAREIKSQIGFECSPNDFFEYRTISEFSRYISIHCTDDLRLNASPHSEENKDVLEGGEQKILLSEGQKGLWAIQKMFPKMTAYNIPLCFRVSNLDLDLFKNAIIFSIKQHPILHSVIKENDGLPYLYFQVFNEKENTIFDVRDCSSVDSFQISTCLKESAKHIFNLETGPLFSVQFLLTSKETTVILMNIHHIIFDGHSVSLLLKIIFDVYRLMMSGKVPKFSPLPIVYNDFAEQEQQMLAGKEGARRLTYWQQYLKEMPPILSLPTDRQRSACRDYFAGDTYSVTLNSDLSEKIQQISKQHQLYFSTIFMGMFKVLLYKYLGQEDIIIGMPVNERNQVGFNQAIGFFINMIPIRSKLVAHDSFLTYLVALQNTMITGLSHSYPFSRLVKELKIHPVLGCSPIFQIAFMYQDFGNRMHELEYPVEFIEEIHQEGEYEFALEVIQKKDHFVLNWKYNPELFDESTLAQVSRHYIKLIKDVTEHPQLPLSEYSLLSEEEKKILLFDWNATKKDYSTHKRVHELFEEQVARTPEKIAVTYQDQSLTYQQLSQKVTEFAKCLQSEKLKNNSLVALCVERSLDMIVGLLGILKSGKAYLPLDPEYPDERLLSILEDSETRLIVTQSRIKNKVLRLQSRQNQSKTSEFKSLVIVMDEPWSKIKTEMDSLEDSVKPLPYDDLAYIIYTSGSTGQPKGVMISHNALTNFLLSMTNEPGLQNTDKLLAVTTYCFDIAALELYLPLITGAECYICDRETAKNAKLLKELIQNIQPTIMQATPSTWSMLFYVGWKNKENIKILCGGEALSDNLKQYFIESNSHAWNLFGPTETTIWSTIAPILKGQPITIGKPIANTQVYILDKKDRLLPIGMPGELCIAGDGVAKGYINKPHLSAQKFTDNPFTHGSKLYHTGDLARFRHDGSIEYLGRMDFQVKLNGFRIELDEIEYLINQHLSVQESVVIVKQQERSKLLVAYYVPKQKGINLSEELKSQLREKLPEYMVPSIFIALDQMPLTANRKIDRNSLKQQMIILNSNVNHTSPQTEVEKAVSNIWKGVLNVENLSIEDGFFDVGGDSISAVIVSERISETFNIIFTVTQLFKYTNVKQIAHYINKLESNELGQDKTENFSTVNSNNIYHEEKFPDYYNQSIAIIGISCHFPGAKDHRKFWKNLKQGKECIQTLSEEELRKAEVPESILQDPNYIPIQFRIEGKENFDHAFFNLSYKNKTFMDPQFRQLLLHSWQALEDAGYIPSDIPETSVFMSASNNFYQSMCKDSNIFKESDEYVAWILAQGGSIPTMISYELGLKGPSMFVHSNCSSSLSALSLACDNLQLNKSKYALVGSSSLFPTLKAGYIYQKGFNFASDGHCRAFDDSADGLVPGEGVAVILLKRAVDAIKDGDHIYALLRGVSLNNDGSDKAGYYAPGVNGQTDVIEKALTTAQVNPESINYIEAHGTGTKLGDPIEIMALTDVYRKHTQKKQFCALGSVKPNIGHLDTVAGLAGCIKVALSLANKEIPPSINYRRPNSEINFEESPFYVVEQLQSWSKDNGTPRRAALSSFGIGGTNAHAILEEYPLFPPSTSSKLPLEASIFLVPLSAKNTDRLNAYAEKLFVFLKQEHDDITSLSDLAYTLQVGREAMECRLIFIVRNLEELIEKLESFIKGNKNIENCFQSEIKLGQSDNVFLEDIQDSEELITQWIAKGKLKKLAELWVRGGQFNWRLLYGNTEPHRLSLPTYPFIEEANSVKSTSLYQSKPSTSEAIGRVMFKPVWEEKAINVTDKKSENIRNIVFLCGMDQDLQILKNSAPEYSFFNLSTTQQLLSKSVLDHLLQVFEYIKNLIRDKTKEPVLLQVIIPKENSANLLASFSALFDVTHIEEPTIWGQVIEVSKDESANSLINKIRNNSHTPEERHICYKNDKRFVVAFETIDEAQLKSNENKTPWRHGGVYLITGGVGGLGWIFTKEIAEKIEHPKLILIGRSPLNLKKQMEFENLEKLGVTLEYKVVDVTNKQEVQLLIENIISCYGELNGILHCAGLIKDNFILKKDKDQFAGVLAPKVEGVLNLHDATANLKCLDFFIMFSSIAGVVGQVGQVDYATANAFMDAFAHKRHEQWLSKLCSGRTLSINWPLWQDGGMTVNKVVEGMLKEQKGLLPISTTSAIDGFYKSLCSNNPQVIIVEGVLDKISTFPYREKYKSNTYIKPTLSSQMDSKDLKENTLYKLKQLVGEVLKTPPAEIESTEALEHYGIDSIAIIQLNNKLENIFGEISKTLFFEYQTLAALCDYFISNYPQFCVQWSATQERHKETLCELDTILINETSKKTVNRSFIQGNSEAIQDEPIAIIGISGRYPQAESLEDYWQNLKNGKDCIVEISKDRWSLDGFFNSHQEEAIAQGKSYSKWGGFIEGFAEFDPLFFGISPKETMNLDPQERIFLQSCWELFEDAGYSKESLAAKFKGKVGIFVGITKTGFALYGPELWKDNELTFPHTSFSSVANRVSYFFNLNGPSMPIDTMCSSSLTAIHEACEHLLRNECEMAVAGGVNLYLHPSNYVELCAQRMLSPDGKCRSFGEGANGFVPGEGVGALLLKKLSKAIQDKDQIHALIRSTSINHGGKTNGYTVPNPVAQRDLVRAALDKAGVSARSVSYLEAHGTGTELGDPIEITGLTQAFQKDTMDTGFCAIGSVKSNLGHLEAAAGIAGVTKVILQMKHKALVPSLHARSLNQNINFNKTPFFVQQSYTEWKRPLIECDGKQKEFPKIAGISSFGAGGANAHIILEEYISEKLHEQVGIILSPPDAVIIVLSAKSQDHLKKYANKIKAFVDLADPRIALEDLAYTLQRGRTGMEERIGFITSSNQHLIQKLQEIIDHYGDAKGVYFGHSKRDKNTLTALIKDQDSSSMLDGLIAKREDEKIVELWVKGLNVDWDKLYKGRQPQRISLPTYPFSKESYWIYSPSKSTEKKSTVKNALASLRLINPESISKISAPSTLERSASIRLNAIHKKPDKEEELKGMFLDNNLLEILDYGEGVFCIKFSCDENRNVLAEDMILELERSFSIIQEQPNLKVILLMGGEQWFLSGNDTEKAVFFSRKTPLLTLSCEVPVIAVMKGQCMGLGWLMASLCDFMIINENSCYHYFPLGMEGQPTKEEYALFEARYGKEFAYDLLFSGNPYTGISLQEKGLGIATLSKNDIDSYALKMANQISKAPSQSLQLLKKHFSEELLNLTRNLLETFNPISKMEAQSALNKNNSWEAFCQKKNECVQTTLEIGAAKRILFDSEVVFLDVYPDGVVVVTLCDKESHNTFSKALVQGTINAFKHINENGNYKAVVLTGYNQYFCCGGTKEGLLAIQQGREKFTDTSIYSLPLESDIPVIAAIQGHAIGAGWALGMFCDYVICSEESIHLSPYMRYGFTPGAGSTLIFPTKFGIDLGREILFTAKEYKAEEFKRRGTRMSIIPRSEVKAYAINLAHQLALSSREDLIALKSTSCHELRHRLPTIYAKELAMHEKSFVHSEEVLQRIENLFDVVDVDSKEEDPKPHPNPEEISQETDHQILEKVRKKLRSTLAEELHMSMDKIDNDIPFIDLGLDSIIGVTWVRKINDIYQLSLSATIVYTHSTVEALASYVVKKKEELAGVQKQSKQASFQESRQYVSSPVKKTYSILSGDYSKSSNLNEEKSSSSSNSLPVTNNDIAIIGMSGQFPKSRTLDEFWDNIANGRDCISAIPASRWDIQQYYDPNPAALGKTHCRWMGILDNVSEFDPLFFNLSPKTAELMDPQQRIFLQASWHCIEDAGYKPSQLSALRCGVFVGCGVNDYASLMAGEQESAEAFMGCSTSILAARISYLLNLQGPCISIDTACSSSLVAIAFACDSLVLGNSDLALAGGVCVLPGPTTHILTSQSGMLSADGRCFAFDERANGFVPGEGVGVILLKRLADAEKDRDSIHAVIRGWGVNQDGKTNGITAPNPDSQSRLIKEVYTKFKIQPDEIQLIEAHGTGTKLGDPIEVEGLTKSFNYFTSKKDYCGLGSVKSNIGHLLNAAGVAGVIKLILSLKHKKLPPTIHYQHLNEHIELKNTPFYVNTKCKDWDVRESQKRSCAVSSFGFSGTNAHVVLGEYVAKELKQKYVANKPGNAFIIVLSACDKERLIDYAKNILLFIEKNNEVNIADLAYTLQIGREAMELRLGFVIHSIKELKEKIKSFIDGNDSTEDFCFGEVKSKEALELFESDKEMVKAIDTWINKGEYKKLISLWVAGLKLDWDHLYELAKPCRISIPGYPFAKEQYWIAPQPIKSVPINKTNVKNDTVLNLFEEKQFSERNHIKKDNFVFTESWQYSPRDIAAHQWASKVEAKRDYDILVISKNQTDYKDMKIFLEKIIDLSQSKGIFHVVQHMLIQDNPYSAFESEKLKRYVNDTHRSLAIFLFLQQPSNNLTSHNELEFIYTCIQSIMRLAAKKSVQFYCCYSDQVSTESLYRDALVGLFKSAMLESVNHRYRSIVYDSQSTSTNQLVSLVLQEWLCDETMTISPARVPMIHYRNGKRLELQINEATDYQMKNNSVAFRQNATYLMVGALGAIGELLCQELGRAYKARLVILSRRTLDKARPILKRIEAAGASVIYRSVDILDASKLSDEIGALRSTGVEIHGVIHMARCVLDAPILKKTFLEFSDVMAAKVEGLLNIDAATAKDPLDFFMVFSSMAALGIKGSPDYAYSAAFQNAMMRYRNYLFDQGKRLGRSLAICWGQWEVDGAVALEKMSERLEQLRRSGVDVISSSSSLDLINMVLTNKQDVVGLLAINDKQKFCRLMGFEGDGNSINEELMLSKVEAFERGELSKLEFARFLKTLHDNDCSDFMVKRIVKAIQNINHSSEKSEKHTSNLIEDSNIVLQKTPLLKTHQDHSIEQKEFEAVVTENVLEGIEQILKIKKDNFNSKRSFQNYGLDSISAMQLSIVLEKDLQFPISPNWFLEYPSLNQLVHKISKEIKSRGLVYE